MRRAGSCWSRGPLIPAVSVSYTHLLRDCADDLLFADGQLHWLSAPRIDNPNTHGTGCTLSSAIACGLAQGIPLADSVKRAKRLSLIHI